MGSSDSSPTRKRLISFVDNKPIHYTNQCTTTAELRMHSAVFCFPFCSLPPRCFLPFTQRILLFWYFVGSFSGPPPNEFFFSSISLGHSPVRRPTNSSFLAFRWVILRSAAQRILLFLAFRWVILRSATQRILLFPHFVGSSFGSAPNEFFFFSISLGHSPVRHPTNSSFLAFRWVILRSATQRILLFPHFVGSVFGSASNEFHFSFISLGHPAALHPTNSTFSSFHWAIPVRPYCEPPLQHSNKQYCRPQHHQNHTGYTV